MKNGKTLVAAAVAAMLAVPASHAAIDDAGMQYTSAAEGFYGSLRMDFKTSDSSTPGAADTDSAGLDVSASRLGVRGTVDLGGGMSAGYNYEFGVNGNNGAAIGNTRLHNVGLSGGFGSVLVGTQWALDYNYVWGKTDVMNVNSGWFTYNANRRGRQSNAITYTSPDFNGFNFGLSAALSSGALEIGSSTLYVGSGTDDDFEKVDRPVVEANNPPNAAIMAAQTALDGAEAAVDTAQDALDAAEEADLDDAQDAVDTAQDALDAATIVADEAAASGATAGQLANQAQYDARLASAVKKNPLPSEEAAAIDKFVMAAGYSFRGFNIAGTYVRRDISTVDATYAYDTDDDATAAIFTETSTNPTSVGLALGYGQDNWSLGYYHAKTDMDTPENNEQLVHSFAGQVGIGKTTLRALYETQSAEENGKQDIDTDFWTLEAQYDLGSRSRVYAEYSQEEIDNPNDSSESSDTNIFLVGYRVDF